MKKTYIIVSIIDLIVLIAFCFFVNCKIDIVAVIIAALVLVVSAIFNIRLFKKLK